ncbi:MAG: peptidylprolyl isomerase [Verrucomicrobia bacterium]|nr:peptidylprolyl isomerase [Verrucomicrobiota bacterium]
MKTPAALRLCLLLPVLLSGIVRGADPARVGVLGSADRLVFEGNQSFSSQRLSHGLYTHGDWLLAAHPEAPLEDYVRATRAALLRGYQRAGFPQVQITETRWLADPQRLLCVIAEGPRYMAGPVTVTGAQAVSVAQIVAKLTTKEKKPADHRAQKNKAEEGTTSSTPAIASEKETASLILKGWMGELPTTASKSIEWETGKPAPLDARRTAELQDLVVKQLAQAGRMQARAEVKTVLDETTHTAGLHVNILSEGPPAMLAGIECRGLKRDSEAALLKYLELEKGRPFLSGQVPEIEDRLLRSARYTSYKVTATPRRTDHPEMDLKLELVEMPEAPRLGEPLNATCETLLKARDWFNALMRSGSEDLVFTLAFQESTGHSGELSVVCNPQRGLLLTLTFSDDAEGRKKPPRCTLRYTPGEVAAFFSAHDGAAGQWLRQPVGRALMANLFVKIETDEPTDNETSGKINFGGSLKSKEGNGLLDFVLTLTPAAALLDSLKYAAEWEHKDGLLVMKQETADGEGKPGAVIEEATGRLREIGNGKGSWNKAHTEFARFRITTAQGAWDEATQELEAQTAGLANSYEAGEGFASWAGWLTEGFLNAGFGKTAELSQEEVARRTAAARDLGRQLDISMPELLNAFTADSSFYVPDTADKPRTTNASTTLVAQLGLAVVDSLVSEGSWPWLLAREVYYSTAGRNEYTGRILEQVRQDPELGPVGCFCAAVLLDWTLPASAGEFRSLALSKMTAADFRKDWGLLVQNCSARKRTAMADLLEKVRAGGQSPETDLLREVFGGAEAGTRVRFNALMDSFLQELRREPDRALAVATTAAMDKMWDETLSGMLREKLTPKGGDGKAVDATQVAAMVGGTEVTRKEVALALEVFRKNAAAAKSGETEAELEQAALKAQIELALLHAAFKAMGNAVKPEQLDEDVRQFVAKNFKGSQPRFLVQLAKEGYTLEEYRMAREKSLVAILMKQKIRGMAPAPTEEEISRLVAQNNAPPERQVKLHTLSLLKKAGDPEGAQQRRLADDLHAKLKEGQNFEDLAKKHSADSRAADGGAMDWMNPEALSPAIGGALGRMKPGDVSGVVDLGTVWIMVKLDEERLLSKSAAEKRKEAEAVLKQKKAAEFYDAWLNNVREKIKVQILPMPVGGATAK